MAATRERTALYPVSCVSVTATAVVPRPDLKMLKSGSSPVLTSCTMTPEMVMVPVPARDKSSQSPVRVTVVTGETAVPGSPPRRRGRPARRACAVPRAGLTPAQAGTARRWTPPPGWQWAHPRAGGDGRPGELWAAAPEGSPPRRRGRPGDDAPQSGVHGLTPAQAGTAPSCPCTTSW